MATDTAPTRSTWDPTRNLWQWPTLLAGLGLFWAVWQGILTIGPANPADALERSLQALRTAVEATSPDPDTLKALTVTTAEQAGKVPDQAPFADFLLGSAHVRLADLATDPAVAREESILAAQFLDRVTADRLPNPEDDGARLAFRSAKAHAGAGRFVGASSPTLTLATRTLMFPPKGEHAGKRLAWPGTCT